MFICHISVDASEMLVIHTTHGRRVCTSYTGLPRIGWSKSERKLGLHSRKPVRFPDCILPALLLCVCSDVAGALEETCFMPDLELATLTVSAQLAAPARQALPRYDEALMPVCLILSISSRLFLLVDVQQS